MKNIITIGYLYADLMNIYGDTGNVITLTKRLEWRGYDVRVLNIEPDTKLKSGEVDIYFFGGGQDQSQIEVSKSLQGNIGKVVKADVERGVPLLSICGGYQLLGDYYAPHNGSKLPGISVFPAYTVASNDRMIGNIVIEVGGRGTGVKKAIPEAIASVPPPPSKLVGFENHSGKTHLKKAAAPLGKVVKGFGNNGEDGLEGCIYKNAIGCYMHGSLLPKNPALADWLIEKALETKFGKTIELELLDDTLENLAHETAIKKFS